MELTQKDRVILINQYQMLKHLDPDAAEHYDEFIEILQKGYTPLYPQIWLPLDESELSEDQCRFVLDVLNLYRIIEKYQDANPQDQDIREHTWGRFRGFDETNESKYLSFARFLLRKQRKFEEFARHAGNTDNFTSDGPTLSKYRNMVAAWKAQGKEGDLSREKILRILEAGSSATVQSPPSEGIRLGGIASLLGNAAEKAKEGVVSLFKLLTGGGAPKTAVKAEREPSAPKPLPRDEPAPEREALTPKTPAAAQPKSKKPPSRRTRKRV